MKEFKVIVDIDREGKIKMETKGFSGSSCVDEIQEILKGLMEIEKLEKTSEFYTNCEEKTVTIKKGSKV